jgi:hypothetical protein
MYTRTPNFLEMKFAGRHDLAITHSPCAKKTQFDAIMLAYSFEKVSTSILRNNIMGPHGPLLKRCRCIVSVAGMIFLQHRNLVSKGVATSSVGVVHNYLTLPGNLRIHALITL